MSGTEDPGSHYQPLPADIPHVLVDSVGAGPFEQSDFGPQDGRRLVAVRFTSNGEPVPIFVLPPEGVQALIVVLQESLDIINDPRLLREQIDDRNA